MFLWFLFISMAFAANNAKDCGFVEELSGQERATFLPDPTAWPEDAPNPTFGPELTFHRGTASEDETFAKLHEHFSADAESKGFVVGKQGDLAPSERGDFISRNAFVVSFPGANPCENRVIDLALNSPGIDSSVCPAGNLPFRSRSSVSFH